MKFDFAKTSPFIVLICSAIMWFYPQWYKLVFVFICCWVVFGFWYIVRQQKRIELPDTKSSEIEQ